MARPHGVRTLVVLVGLAGLLMVLVAVLLVDLSILNLQGTDLFPVIGGIELILAILSFVAVAGLWTGKGWARLFAGGLAVISMVYNAVLIGLAATFTAGLAYPGGATVS